jgi:outer membrane protein TolC
MGLATGPAVLLAQQVEAQAGYDLEKAKSMVHDADAGLRQAVGVAPDTDIRIQGGHLDRLPANLSYDVETMMAEAPKQRPDIAAQIATVRSDDAAISRARAEFYPEVEISGNYGQMIWSYTVNGGHTQNLNQPFYGTLLSLRWDLVTGFDRYYGLQKATAARDAARSELKTLQLNVITGVWTAYYDYLSAKKQRDAPRLWSPHQKTPIKPTSKVIGMVLQRSAT